jgi:hypothetical protein
MFNHPQFFRKAPRFSVVSRKYEIIWADILPQKRITFAAGGIPRGNPCPILSGQQKLDPT